MDGDGPAADDVPQGGMDWEAEEFIHPVDTSTQVIVETHQKTASCVAGRYLKGAVLGEGSYGKVKEMLDVLSLHRRAVKILNKRRLRKITNGEANVEREIQLLRNLKHEHIVKLIEVLYNEEKLKIYMILEYLVCPLEEMLKSTKEQKFPIQQGHNYFCQTIKGLEYLHSQRVVHKDIKPDNLLLSQDGIVKICDFGVAERLDLFSSDDAINTSQGSPVFQPPEVSLGVGSMSGFKLDVYAAGVTLYHFVSGDYPFMGDTLFQLFEAIGKGVYNMPTGLSEPLEDLIRGMLEYDATKRLSVHQIMKHSWFTSSHPLQKKESWIAIPPLEDFENDPLRGLTCVDSLMSLHQHNLPTCPIYLSEEHMMYLFNKTPPPQHGSQQRLPSGSSFDRQIQAGVQDSILDAANASYHNGSSSAPDSGLSSRPCRSIGEASNEVISPLATRTGADASRSPSSTAGAESDLPTETGDLFGSGRLVGALSRRSPAIGHTSPSSSSLLSLERKQKPFQRSASASSARLRSMSSSTSARLSRQKHLAFGSADDNMLRQHEGPFRPRALTSTDATDSLSTSMKRLFRRSGASSVSSGTGVSPHEPAVVPHTVHEGPPSRDSNFLVPRSGVNESIDDPISPEMPATPKAVHGSYTSGQLLSDNSVHSFDRTSLSRRASTESNMQKQRQQNFFKTKGASSSDTSATSVVTTSVLSQRISDISNPSFLSNGSKKNLSTTPSEGAVPLHLPSHRVLRRVLSTNEEDDAEMTVEDAVDSKQSGGATAKVENEPRRGRLGGRDSSRKEINTDRKARRQKTGDSRGSGNSHAPHGPFKRMRRAVQCRQQ